VQVLLDMVTHCAFLQFTYVGQSALSQQGRPLVGGWKEGCALCFFGLPMKKVECATLLKTPISAPEDLYHQHGQMRTVLGHLGVGMGLCLWAGHSLLLQESRGCAWQVQPRKDAKKPCYI